MLKLRSLGIVLAGCLLFGPSLWPQQAAAPAAETELLRRIRAIPGVVKAQASRFDAKSFAEAYEVMFEQPVDHRKPEGAKFRQRLFLAHAGYDKPVVLVTEGYGAGGSRAGELTRLLGANQVNVEHRFFGRSVPAPLSWADLTVRSSADDLHAVVLALKALYPGKWVSTGVSKSGQTALFYKCFYPDDVDATVPYSAPMNVAQEDPRLYHFLETVGDEAARARVKDYQKALLRREDELLPLVAKWAESRKWTVGRLGLAAAYEYGVLEYPFAFWQYGSLKPADIPAADAPIQALFDHYRKINAFYFYTDQGQKAFEPFMYQAFTEIGYYNYDVSDFRGLLKALDSPTNRVLCPEGAEIVYDPRTMDRVYRFLQYEADRVVYIYGGLDTWAATQVPLIGRTDALKIVVPTAHHGVGIGDFSAAQKELFLAALERWLGVKLPRG